MLCPLSKIAWRTKQLNVVDVVRAAESDWDDVIFVIPALDRNSTSRIGASELLSLQKRLCLLSGVSASVAFLSGSTRRLDCARRFWIFLSPSLVTSSMSLWMFSPPSCRPRSCFARIVLPFSVDIRPSSVVVVSRMIRPPCFACGHAASLAIICLSAGSTTICFEIIERLLLPALRTSPENFHLSSLPRARPIKPGTRVRGHAKRHRTQGS